VEKISEISMVWIARYKHSNSLKLFFAPHEKQGSCTSQDHFSMKNCPKWWGFIGIFFLDKLATCLKIFTSFGIIQHIGKKIVSRIEK